MKIVIENIKIVINIILLSVSEESDGVLTPNDAEALITQLYSEIRLDSVPGWVTTGNMIPRASPFRGSRHIEISYK